MFFRRRPRLPRRRSPVARPRLDNLEDRVLLSFEPTLLKVHEAAAGPLERQQGAEMDRLAQRLDDSRKANARDEDFTRVSADLVLLVASVASLIAIFFLVDEAGKRHGAARVVLAILAVTVVVLSWLLVQTVYTVRYGDLYYGDPIGGIDFNDGGDPDYHDFLYLAFTIGMTYQVSDTNLGTKTLRRTAIRHAFLSFVFVTVILAVTINVVASLLK